MASIAPNPTQNATLTSGSKPGNPQLQATGRAATASGNARLASDSTALEGLRNGAAKDPRAAAKDAAKQFESLFMNELMKSMRAATETSGLFDNAGTKLADVVKALNALGATPLDLLAILQAMKSAGALHAEIEVI